MRMRFLAPPLMLTGAAVLLAACAVRTPTPPSVVPDPGLAILHGCVTDVRGKGIPGALIAIQSLNIGVMTGADGCYVLRSPRFGPGRVRAMRIGHDAVSADVDLRPGDVHLRSFRLEKDTPPNECLPPAEPGGTVVCL